MAFDEDAVLEAIARLQPALDAITQRLDALEALPSGIEIIHPIKVVNEYAGDIPDATWVKE